MVSLPVCLRMVSMPSPTVVVLPSASDDSFFGSSDSGTLSSRDQMAAPFLVSGDTLCAYRRHTSVATRAVRSIREGLWTVLSDIRVRARNVLFTGTEPFATTAPVLAPIGRPKPTLATVTSVSSVSIFMLFGDYSAVKVDI